MLSIKNVSKVYVTEDIELHALNHVSLNLRRNEFVSILGPSGSGKTTLLNIIGGLDHYTSGDIIIDGVSTKKYTASDWDAYRNRRIGFVFQNYNLISHQSILSNVELALTLSGVSGAEKRERATEALKKVGLGSHLNKRPAQLSGGQMQRVAIARALVNNPDIILADEPTGALDSKTSVQIMELLKEIAKDKLVVMVTHNPELANQYSTRIINVKDGKITSDTDPYDDTNEVHSKEKIQHTSISFGTALRLSRNNLMTKRGRTILTAIAGSIGIIGIALILALANGVNNYANNMMSDTTIPSAITIQETYLDTSVIASTESSSQDDNNHNNAIVATDDLKTNYNVSKQRQMRHNDTTSLKKYLDSHSSEMQNYTTAVQYVYDVDIPIYDRDNSGKIIQINPIAASANSALGGLLDESTNISVTENDFIKTSTKEIVSNSTYDLLSGALPQNANELLLVTDTDGNIPLSVAYALNLADRTKLAEFVNKINHGGTLDFGNKSINYDQIVGKTYKLTDSAEDYNQGYDLKIVGVAKTKSKGDASGYLGYTPKLTEYVIKNSNGKYTLDTPTVINIYAKTESDKDKVNSLLDSYNNQASDNQKIHYVDETKALIETIKNVVNVLSFVLIGFVGISLVVSSIMIGIITYISVLERTKEIGILRAIGASKRDVVRVFRAETVIEGLIAGLLGVFISWLLCLVVNFLVSAIDHIDNIANLTILHALVLVLISVILTVFAGASPARRASKKDPVEALRSE